LLNVKLKNKFVHKKYILKIIIKDKKKLDKT